MDEGRYIGLRCIGVIQHYVECPTCNNLIHLYTQKPDKVHSCYYCARPFVEPHSKQEEEWG